MKKNCPLLLAGLIAGATAMASFPIEAQAGTVRGGLLGSKKDRGEDKSKSSTREAPRPQPQVNRLSLGNRSSLNNRREEPRRESSPLGHRPSAGYRPGFSNPEAFQRNNNRVSIPRQPEHSPIQQNRNPFESRNHVKLGHGTSNQGGLLGQPAQPQPQQSPVQNPGNVLGGRTNYGNPNFNRETRLPRQNNDGILGSRLPRRDEGLTPAGRVLGSAYTVDEHGRTDVGRALGTPTVPRAQGKVTYRHAPVYGYDPHSGRYDRWDHDDRRRSRVHVSVLLGTVAPRPTYRFHYGDGYGLYYYPYYCANTVDLGYSVYPSPYYYYGYGPSYIPSPRVIVVDRPVIVRDGYVGDSDGYYLNRMVEQDLDVAMADIRKAWTLGDVDLLLRHVRFDQEIHVYLKGDYIYSLPAEDYRDLTKDAMQHSTTTGFRWVDLDRQGDDEVRAQAEHSFTDRDGQTRKVYVTFTLVNIYGAWWIAEVGTSDRK